MTKIAIISDVHANIAAVDLVLKDIEKKNVDKIVCLGDLVTKYFYPAEVVDAIRANADMVIKGNCDHLVASDVRYQFARSKLGLGRIEYLDCLPITEQLMINRVLLRLCHSNPESLDAMFNPKFNKNRFTSYSRNLIDDYTKMFLNSDPQVLIVGHTHDDYIGIEENRELKLVDSPAIITNEMRAIVNVGSVGEHSHMVKVEDGYETCIDPFLTYAIIDDSGLDNAINVSIEKVPYRETLKKVYMDMVLMQNEKRAPYSPSDTKKVWHSLENMGYKDEDFELKKRGKNA